MPIEAAVQNQYRNTEIQTNTESLLADEHSEAFNNSSSQYFPQELVETKPELTEE